MWEIRTPLDSPPSRKLSCRQEATTTAEHVSPQKPVESGISMLSHAGSRSASPTCPDKSLYSFG